MIISQHNILKSHTQSESPMRTLAPRGWILRVSAALAVLAAACSAGAEDPVVPEATGTTQAAIYSGTVDSDESANGGVVSLKVGNGTSFELCSGTLIAPNVVLTARHCVSHNLTPTVSCDEHGKSGNGQHTGNDEDPTSIHVFVGSNPNFGKQAAANGQAIFHPGGNILCNADIALLVLDSPIATVQPLKVRLNGVTRDTETVRSVGFGQNDLSLPVGTRLRRENVPVLAVGQVLSKSQTPLATHEFEVGLSICQGDSGGPAISEITGAVIGVVSRGGGCKDDFGHIYTSTAGFSSMFEQAFAMAGGAPTDEGGTGVSGSLSTDHATTGSKTNRLQADAAAKGCAGRIAGTSRTSDWSLGGAFVAIGLLVARRRRKRS